ncbi:MAG TPA: hypothetical protein VFQ47_09865, partial [Nitrososphaera sp.]|nr:hypothetical protein [Nitrososphaera sp.]
IRLGITFILDIRRDKLFVRMGSNDNNPSVSCALCGSSLTFRYKPMPEWNISGQICGQCYDKKLFEHYLAPYRKTSQKGSKD